MPIQRNLDDLEIFCVQLLDKGFKKDIGIYNLRYAIAKKFGYSDYIQRSTLKALMEFGLIKQVAPGRFKITVLNRPEDAEKEAEQEIDAKFGLGGTPEGSVTGDATGGGQLLPSSPHGPKSKPKLGQGAKK